MNLYVTISLALLAILAALWYLIKVKNESPGAFFKWSGYLVLIAAVGLLLCLVYKGGRKMQRRNHKSAMECTHGNYHGNSGKNKGSHNCFQNSMNCSMNGENCCCCSDSGMMKRKNSNRDMEDVSTESTTDTIDGKIIKKEITISR